MKPNADRANFHRLVLQIERDMTDLTYWQDKLTQSRRTIAAHKLELQDVRTRLKTAARKALLS